jgi:hypothetical protein
MSSFLLFFYEYFLAIKKPRISARVRDEEDRKVYLIRSKR